MRNDSGSMSPVADGCWAESRYLRSCIQINSSTIKSYISLLSISFQKGRCKQSEHSAIPDLLSYKKYHSDSQTLPGQFHLQPQKMMWANVNVNELLTILD